MGYVDETGIASVDSATIKAAAVIGAVVETCAIYLSFGSRPFDSSLMQMQCFAFVAFVGLLCAATKNEARRIPPRILTTALLLLGAAWVGQLNRLFWHEWIPVRIAAWSAVLELASAFLVFAILAFPLWTRRPSLAILCCSVLCLGWSGVELVFRVG